jgi:hypothetical protein
MVVMMNFGGGRNGYGGVVEDFGVRREKSKGS